MTLTEVPSDFVRSHAVTERVTVWLEGPIYTWAVPFLDNNLCSHNKHLISHRYVSELAFC